MSGLPGARAYGSIQMAGLSAGVVAAADLNSQPTVGSSKMDTPAAWSTIWFAVATVYLVGLYYGMISIRSTTI